MSKIDTMMAAARRAMDHAYAPYSGFHVGCCIRTDNHQLIAGCNVENASYGLTQCAEASAIGALITAGEQRILEVVIVAEGDSLCTPCGACRQRLREFAEEDVLIHVCDREGVRKTFTLGELLPASFGPQNLVD